MKRGFIRALWGVYQSDWDAEKEEKFKTDKNHIFVQSRDKVDREIKGRMKDKFSVDFTTYVFGVKNYEHLIKLGIKNVVMVNEEPVIYTPLNRRTWWHKMDILKYAMEEDGYDEIIYLDWDCWMLRELPSNFWDILHEKENFQACLMRYKRGSILSKSSYRNKSSSKVVPNGGFVYIGDKSIPAKIIEFRSVGGNRWLDEAAYAKYLDDRCDKWVGVDEYEKRFEPDVCQFGRGLFKKEDPCFRHY